MYDGRDDGGGEDDGDGDGGDDKTKFTWNPCKRNLEAAILSPSKFTSRRSGDSWVSTQCNFCSTHCQECNELFINDINSTMSER